MLVCSTAMSVGVGIAMVNMAPCQSHLVRLYVQETEQRLVGDIMLSESSVLDYQVQFWLPCIFCYFSCSCVITVNS